MASKLASRVTRDKAAVVNFAPGLFTLLAVAVRPGTLFFPIALALSRARRLSGMLCWFSGDVAAICYGEQKP